MILVVGQSNASGYGQGLDVTYIDTPDRRTRGPADPRIHQIAGDGSTACAGQVVPAIDPLIHHKNAPNGNRVGSAMTSAKEHARSVPLNRNVLLVPAAHGDTGFTTTSVNPAPSAYHLNGANDAGCWDPAATDRGVDIAAYAVAQANAALAPNPNNWPAAIPGHHGEADGGYLDGAQYAAPLDRRDREPYEWTPTVVSGVVQAQSLARWLLERRAVAAAA